MLRKDEEIPLKNSLFGNEWTVGNYNNYGMSEMEVHNHTKRKYSETSVSEHPSNVINLLYWTVAGPTERFLLVLTPSNMITPRFWMWTPFLGPHHTNSTSTMWTWVESAIYLSTRIIHLIG